MIFVLFSACYTPRAALHQISRWEQFWPVGGDAGLQTDQSQIAMSAPGPDGFTGTELLEAARVQYGRFDVERGDGTIVVEFDEASARAWRRGSEVNWLAVEVPVLVVEEHDGATGEGVAWLMSTDLEAGVAARAWVAMGDHALSFQHREDICLMSDLQDCEGRSKGAWVKSLRRRRGELEHRWSFAETAP